MKLLTRKKIDPDKKPINAPNAWVVWLTYPSHSSDASFPHQFCVRMKIRIRVDNPNLNNLTSLGIGKASGGL